MIEKIVNKIMEKIIEKNPNVKGVKKDAIWFGLMMLFDEVPKFILMCLITYFLGILRYTLISFGSIFLYRAFSGGFHLRSQIGCFSMSMLLFVGNPIIGKYIIWPNEIFKYIIFVVIWIFNMVMIYKYAPADTEDVPIVSKSQRNRQKIISFVMMNLVFIAGIFITDVTISNILIFGTLIQSFCISRVAYKIFNNKYGHEVYKEEFATV